MNMTSLTPTLDKRCLHVSAFCTPSLSSSPPQSRRATDFFACGVTTAATLFSRAAAVDEKSCMNLVLCKIDLKSLRAILINGEKYKADFACGFAAKARTQRQTQRPFYRHRVTRIRFT